MRRWINKNWDYYYLLDLERNKLKKMAKFFAKSKLTEGWEFQVRDCRLCAKLIDIILEEDAYYKNWLDKSFGNKVDIKKFPVHVNLRNVKRFYLRIHKTDSSTFESYKATVRTVKALYLYNRIRSLRMFSWWE